MLPRWQLIPLGYLYIVYVIVGGIGNLLMVVVTVKSRHLRQSCNYLIALSCLADLVHVLGHIPFTVYVINWVPISQELCFFINFVPLIGLFACVPLLFCLSIDRLLAILFASWYQSTQVHNGKYVYLGVLLTFPTVVTFLQLRLCFIYRSKIPVNCDIPAAMFGGFELFQTIQVILYPLVLILNLVLIILVKRMGVNSNFKSIFKSISANLFVLFLGFILTIGTSNVTLYLPIKENTKELIYLYAGLGMTTAICSNVFVYYYFRRLRHSCNYLLALSFISDLAHILGHIPFIIYVINWKFIPQELCFRISFIPLIGVFLSVPLQCCITLDRIFAILFATSYKQTHFHMKKYLGCLISFPVVMASIEMYYCLINTNNGPVNCDIPAAIRGGVHFVQHNHMILYPMVGVLNCILLILVRKIGGNVHFKSIIKSISVNFFLLLFAFFVTIVTSNILLYLPSIPENTKEIIILYSGLGATTAISAHIFVFYNFSSLYRMELRKLLGMNNWKSTVHPTNLN